MQTPFHLTPQAAAPTGTAAEGDLYYDSVTHTWRYHNGTSFIDLGSYLNDDANFSGGLTASGGLFDIDGVGRVNHKKQVTDTGGAFATPIALTEAQSGRLLLGDDAAGLDFTLPALAATQIGTYYEILVTTSVTSNSLRFTAQAGDLLRGGVFIVDFNTANTGTYFTPDESDDLVFSMNGTTTGGKKGTRVRLTAITATGWFIDGLVFGDGTLATPFA